MKQDSRCYGKGMPSPACLAAAAAAGAAAVVLVDYLCFRSFYFLVFSAPGSVFAMWYQTVHSRRKRKEVLCLQFKEMLLSLGGAMEAGYSMERGFAYALEELKRLYGPRSDMVWEVLRILEAVELNQTVEEALEDFAVRSGLEDVRNFSQVFAAAHRGSGSLSKVIYSAARTMSRKLRTEEEIKTLTAARMMEQRILFVMPFVLLFYMDITSPGFLDVMYTTLAGRIIMVCCLAAGIAAWAVSERMMKIEL